MCNIVRERIQDSITVKTEILLDDQIQESIYTLANAVTNSLKEGNKLILCGNGGSASDALHFAGEIVGRFQKERDALPAVVLNADVTTMTAVANDYCFEDIFARQAQAHVKKGDFFIGISTSGNSENVYRAMKVAQNQGAYTAALLGKDGGKVGKESNYSIIVPSNVTARIQESHIMIIHILCELIENAFTGE